MAIHPKVLRLLFLGLLTFVISGCENATNRSGDEAFTTEFPRDKQGYPKCNIVIINGAEYTLKNWGGSHIKSHIDQEIELQGIKEGDCLEVILPQYLPINFWSMEEKETIDLINYNKSELSVHQTVEGVSAYIQKFTFTITNDKNLLFKWSNVNECGKSFTEKEDEYLLRISIA